MRSRWLAPCVAGLLVAGVSAESGAQPVVQGEARTVLAAVISGQGRPVVDVGVDDFVVTEGGQSRDVLDVHVADYPLALVIDDRTASSAVLPAILQSARRFAQRVGERPIALLRLSDASHLVVTLDDERSTLLERLSGVNASESDTTGPLDTVARAALLLKDSGAPFSAVIAITGGPVDATAPVRGELLPQIIDSGASVHVVRLQASATADALADRSDLLQVIADQTRGQSTTIYSSASFDAALDRLADRLAIEMMVEYIVPPGPKTGDVRVGVRIPGARVVGLGVK